MNERFKSKDHFLKKFPNWWDNTDLDRKRLNRSFDYHSITDRFQKLRLVSQRYAPRTDKINKASFSATWYDNDLHNWNTNQRIAHCHSTETALLKVTSDADCTAAVIGAWFYAYSGFLDLSVHCSMIWLWSTRSDSIGSMISIGENIPEFPARRWSLDQWSWLGSPRIRQQSAL